MVAFLLTLTSAASGALAGFVLGVAAMALGLGPLPPVALVVAVAITLVLDRFAPPLSLGRQVPQLWGRVFAPRAVAVLYGARLGVGPLTILRTWWWWTALGLASVAGVWWACAVGAAYGASRILVLLAAGTRVAALRPRERWISTPLTASVALASLAAAAFAAAPLATSGTRLGRDEPRKSAPADPADPGRGGMTTTVELAPAPLVDDGLAAELPAEIGDGFVRVDDEASAGLGPLDLARAAAAEEDPHAEHALLRTRRFEGGHARAWRHPDGRVAYAVAYRFATGADAAAYLVDGFITLESRGARVYDVTDVPGARGFSQAAGREVAHGVAFVRDDRFLLVFESASASTVDPAGAARLARLLDRDR